MKVVGAEPKIQGNVALAEARTARAKAPARKAEAVKAKASMTVALP
jgi:hypothetical protein